MNPNCSQCGEKSVKNGFVQGNQRWKCKDCHYQFTRTEPRGKPLWMKLEAALLYMNGMSLNSIGNLLSVSAQSILNWVRDFALANYEKPEPASVVVVELDEMWHFIQKKSKNSGFGKHILVMAADSSTGSLEVVMLKRWPSFSND